MQSEYVTSDRTFIGLFDLICLLRGLTLLAVGWMYFRKALALHLGQGTTDEKEPFGKFWHCFLLDYHVCFFFLNVNLYSTALLLKNKPNFNLEMRGNWQKIFKPCNKSETLNGIQQQ